MSPERSNTSKLQHLDRGSLSLFAGVLVRAHEKIRGNGRLGSDMSTVTATAFDITRTIISHESENHVRNQTGKRIMPAQQVNKKRNDCLGYL